MTNRTALIKIGGDGKPLQAGLVALQDDATGLLWTLVPGRFKWAAAKQACADLRTFGRTDWRLPSLVELETPRDLSRRNPAVYPEFELLGVRADWYWSSTPLAGSEGSYAWLVSFGYGYAYYYGQDLEAFVLAVCSARASQ